MMCKRKTIELFIHKGNQENRWLLSLPLVMAMVQTISYHFQDIQTASTIRAMEPQRGYYMQLYMEYEAHLASVRQGLVGNEKAKDLTWKFFNGKMRTVDITMYMCIMIRQKAFIPYMPHDETLSKSSDTEAEFEDEAFAYKYGCELLKARLYYLEKMTAVLMKQSGMDIITDVQQSTTTSGFDFDTEIVDFSLSGESPICSIDGKKVV